MEDIDYKEKLEQLYKMAVEQEDVDACLEILHRLKDKYYAGKSLLQDD